MKLSSLLSVVLIPMTLSAIGLPLEAKKDLPETGSRSHFVVECESFKHKGGWLVDHQAFEKIHSSYLIAHGNGTPVEDAFTDVTVSRQGEYHVFVSTYNWTAPWYKANGPGAFQIAVDDYTLPIVLGTEGTGWGWQYAGKVDISSDSFRLTLKDLSGFDGRVDAVYFSTRKEAPSCSYKSFDKNLREVSESHDIPKADLVVIGGGIAGCSTALTAARYGLDVILVDNQAYLGGNAQLGVTVDGVGWKNLYPKLGSITCEIAGFSPDQKNDRKNYWYDPNGIGGLSISSYRRDYRKPVTDSRTSDFLEAARVVRARGDSITDPRELNVLETEYIRKNTAINREHILKEAGVRVFQNIQIYNVGKKGKSISEATGKNLLTGESYIFRGTLFADCTGDGSLGYLAGADYMIGREPKDFANEISAPERPDHKVMGGTMYWYAFPRNDSGSFPKPEEIPWAMQIDKDSYQKPSRSLGVLVLSDWAPQLAEKPYTQGYTNGWWWETGMDLDQAKDAELARDNLLRAIYGNWAYAKNFDPDYSSYRLDYVQRIFMKRESRRLVGDVVLSENDILSKKAFEDASFTTTWTIDIHTATPDNAARFPGWEWLTMSTNDKAKAVVDRYDVPYRCLYSRNIDNLFIGGRCMSVTHLALGTVRVQLTLGMAGEVAGMAASLCHSHGCFPRDIYREYLDELKSLMDAGAPDSSSVALSIP